MFIKSVKRSTQNKITTIVAWVIAILLYVYWCILAVSLLYQSSLIAYNTDKVLTDDGRVTVEHINKDGRLYLEDTSKVSGDDITEYIRTAVGSGVYYISDNKMSAEISLTEAKELSRMYYMLSVVCLVILTAVCFMFSKFLCKLILCWCSLVVHYFVMYEYLVGVRRVGCYWGYICLCLGVAFYFISYYTSGKYAKSR